jgi:hypothetical protein
MSLTHDELREVLARAEEIQSASRQGEEMSVELEAVIAAAEEVGLARPAVERAIRERLNLPAAPPAVGTVAFAPSADGKLYAAEVLSVSPGEVRVRFLRGSEHSVSLDQLRPCSMIPGERVVCNWPMWGTWTCTVVAYDAAKRKVKLSDGWGYTRTFPLAEVWIAPPRRAEHPGGSRLRVYVTLMGVGAGLGALLGTLITALVLR